MTELSTPAFSEEDVAYATSGFVELEDLCRSRSRDVDEVRGWIADGLVPEPTYVLPDGRLMVPSDLLDLVDDAGRIENVRAEFVRRLAQAADAARSVHDPEEEWNAYLSGAYGACLRRVSPETIVEKTSLMRWIEELLAAPRPEAADWIAALKRSVDCLDELERPFAPHYDRLRFGGPSSRDRLITAVRDRYPAIAA
jgi:Family of unknown function (DUF6058)